MTKTQEIIDKFVEICGSIEEWGNDKKEWRAALGVFILGWNAREELVEVIEKTESIDYCRTCKKVTVKNKYDFCTICNSRSG